MRWSILILYLVFSGCKYSLKTPNAPMHALIFKSPSPVPLIFTKHQTIDTIMLGDINFDFSPDTAFVISPLHSYWSANYNSDDWCDDPYCTSEVLFNFDTTILRSTGLGFYQLFATEDLDEDGLREIVLIPNWFHSNWQCIEVYRLHAFNWERIGQGSVFTSNEYNYKRYIRKIRKNEFDLYSMEYEESGDNWTEVPHRIRLKP